MDELRKNAYRHLLYVAMISIRTYCQSRGPKSFNPITWYRAYKDSRIAGATADWLHNLADYGTRDFVGFNESEFWDEFEHHCKRYPHSNLRRYKKIFDGFLNGDIKIC